MKILLIEDDLDLGNGVRIALADQAFDVIWVRLKEDAIYQLETSPYDLVLLDLGLPDGNGMTLVTHIRSNPTGIPIIILSARDALEDRLRGLDAGADDYLVKPFALAELLSRVRALTRRSYGFENEMLEVRGLCLDVSTRRVSVNDSPVELTLCEYTLLELLMMRSDQVVSRRLLQERATPGASDKTSNSLDVHMTNLRRKMGESYIRTVRGVGFIIDKHPARREVL